MIGFARQPYAIAASEQRSDAAPTIVAAWPAAVSDLALTLVACQQRDADSAHVYQRPPMFWVGATPAKRANGRG